MYCRAGRKWQIGAKAERIRHNHRPRQKAVSRFAVYSAVPPPQKRRAARSPPLLGVHARARVSTAAKKPEKSPKIRGFRLSPVRVQVRVCSQRFAFRCAFRAIRSRSGARFADGARRRVRQFRRHRFVGFRRKNRRAARHSVSQTPAAVQQGFRARQGAALIPADRRRRYTPCLSPVNCPAFVNARKISGIVSSVCRIFAARNSAESRRSSSPRGAFSGIK